MGTVFSQLLGGFLHLVRSQREAVLLSDLTRWIYKCSLVMVLTGVSEMLFPELNYTLILT